MFDGLMLAHDLVERVTVVPSHEEEDHAGALPPDVVLVTLGEEETGWEPDGYGLAGSGSLET